jgi:hypothetical protein
MRIAEQVADPPTSDKNHKNPTDRTSHTWSPFLIAVAIQRLQVALLPCVVRPPHGPPETSFHTGRSVANSLQHFPARMAENFGR